VSRGWFAGSRVVFLITLSAALFFVFAVGAGSGAASTRKSSSVAGHTGLGRTAGHFPRSTTVRLTRGPSLICEVFLRARCTQIGCNSASRRLDGTIVHAYWCWNEGEELTSLTWTNTQEDPWPQTGSCPDGITDVKQSPIAPTYVYNANETFTTLWWDKSAAGCGGGGSCWQSYDLKATVWAPPNPGIGVSETNSDTGCWGLP
jgi:hypothetical protein